MLNLNDREWHCFRLTDIFDLARGREGNMTALRKGEVPLISARNASNGLKGFVCNPGSLMRGNTISLNNDGDGGAGLAYYQPFEYALDTHVTALIPKRTINENIGLFIATILSKLHGFFGHGLSISNKRARRIQIILPVDEQGEPDWEFMDAYIRERKKQKMGQQITFLERELFSLGGGDEDALPTLADRAWREIPIRELFSSLENGKGRGLNHLTKTDSGGIEYIGATNRGDGVLCFVEEDSESTRMIQPGNCIGFIRNGDGSAGYATYRTRRFISTSDVAYGRAKWLNENTGRFFVTAQDMIKDKYSHGHKRSTTRLRGDRVMLPVDEQGEPDWRFIEDYIKRHRRALIERLLRFLESQSSLT